ncbi:MAG TPA: aldo/keto reductase, partial [Clostridiales bacterium]|nr:aldo/keto reductase [Clostridiales bacterium]
DFCQIQYNFLDERHQAGTEGLKYAAQKGMAVVIMEPLKGGRLAKTPPAPVREIWERAGTERTPAEWGLRWVWNHPEVATVLSGMNEWSQVEENIRIAEGALPGSLSEGDLGLIDLAKIKYRELVKVPCTSCGYCLPCPVGVSIPVNFTLYNQASMYDEYVEQADIYNKSLTAEQRASACVKCGKCETLCPQHLEIRKYLDEIAGVFGR